MRTLRRTGLLLALVLLGGCSLVARPEPPGAPMTPGEWFEEGVASWYGHPFHGRQTASGERYDMEAPTAAHQSLPFGTIVEVYNLDNGRRTQLRINDRGPFVDNRIIDVSRYGARRLDMIGPGTARVRLAIVDAPRSVGCWEVQGGSFSSPENAAGLRERFEDEGHPARVVREDGVHRVLLGPFTSEAEANRVAGDVGGLVRSGCAR